MKKYMMLFFAAFAVLILPASSAYGFSLNISPPSFKATVKPGGSTSGTITIQNNSENDTGILAYVQDWQYDSEGSKVFHAAGTLPLSCAKWIRVFPNKFQLASKESLGIQFTINVPEDAEGGYYAVIFAESVPVNASEADEGMMVRFSGRLGTIIYLETEGRSSHEGVVKSLSITPPQSNSPLETDISFKNTGNTHISASGTLNIIDEQGNMFGKKNVGSINTLPGDTRDAKIEWLGELDEGDYYGILTLDIGADEPIVKEVPFSVFAGGAISAISVDTSSEKPECSVIVKNTGHLNIDASGKVEVLSENGELIRDISLKKQLIAPGREKELKADLEGTLPRGNYTAKAVISIGDKELTKEEEFSVE